MLKLLKPAALCAASITLAACASTGVIPFSQDTYLIGKKDASPGRGVSLSTKTEVLKEAHAFCAKKGQETSIVRVESTPTEPFQFGSTEMVFRCVAPGGSAPALMKDADQVIEIRAK